MDFNSINRDRFKVTAQHKRRNIPLGDCTKDVEEKVGPITVHRRSEIPNRTGIIQVFLHAVNEGSYVRGCVPESGNFRMRLQNRDQILSMIRMRMCQADEMELFARNDVANARTRGIGARMRIHKTEPATRKSDNDCIADAGIVEINPELFQAC